MTATSPSSGEGGEKRMPHVVAKVRLDADPGTVWRQVTAVGDFPDLMESVRVVEELSVQGDPDTVVEAVVGWEVELDGAVLRWVEREVRDAQARTVRFSQISGDLTRFEGEWRIAPHPDGGTDSRLEIDFEIGFPMLREVLDPYATRLILDNSTSMLLALDRTQMPQSHLGALG